ncbi:MAG: hypothetical protein LLG20_18925 [Acidobacteriales bacterium]|nr:hypothetical protein [Terriglobales bacterium]
MLKQTTAGRKVTDPAWEYGVNEATIYTRRSRVNGLAMNKALRLRKLEREDSELRLLVADPGFAKKALKTMSRGNGWSFHARVGTWRSS